MIELNLGPERGGTHAFDNEREVAAFAKHQAAKWSRWARQISSSPAYATRFRYLSDGWSELEATPEIASDKGLFLIEYESSAGEGLRQIQKENGNESLKDIYDIYLYNSISNKMEIPDFIILNKNNFDQILKFYAIVEGVGSKSYIRISNALMQKMHDDSSGNSYKIIERGIPQLEHLRIQQNAIEQYIEKSQSFIASLQSKSTAQEKEFSEDQEERRRLADEQRQEFQEKFDNHLKAHDEAIKVHATVELWKERAQTFAADAKASRRAAFGAGFIGLMLAVAWAIAAHSLAEWLFSSSYVPDPSQKGPPPGLRPTLHFELIFTSAATLLYLTAYFWLVRFLVRKHLSDHHLAIDFAGRASMAETYLALIAEGGATTEEDRAIVLASLFRPVADGMVRDDGAPAFSPATLLANLASGK